MTQLSVFSGRERDCKGNAAFPLTGACCDFKLSTEIFRDQTYIESFINHHLIEIAFKLCKRSSLNGVRFNQKSVLHSTSKCESR